MQATMPLGDFLVAYLKRAGVSHIFGIIILNCLPLIGHPASGSWGALIADLAPS